MVNKEKQDSGQKKSLKVIAGVKNFIGKNIIIETNLLAHKNLEKDLKFTPKDTLDQQIDKLRRAYIKFERDRQGVLKDIHNALSGMNDVRKKNRDLRQRVIQDLVESDTDGNFKKLNAKLQAAEKALDSKNLTSEQLQIEQGNYNFCAYEMDKEVDKAMLPPGVISGTETPPE